MSFKMTYNLPPCKKLTSMSKESGSIYLPTCFKKTSVKVKHSLITIMNDFTNLILLLNREYFNGLS
jgi:hypothetical protein